MTRPELLKYVETLEKELQEVFITIDMIESYHEDTLSDEFQISCEIVEIFEKYAKRRYE